MIDERDLEMAPTCRANAADWLVGGLSRVKFSL